MTRNLDLAPIGNCAISALVDLQARFVWCCVPRIDGDPFFSNLLGPGEPSDPDAQGLWAIDVAGAAQSRQNYLRNTPILRTEIVDAA
ncbi:MAG: glycoside hydrolase family 15 protein, partial [Caulobacteraceae bacterium]